MNANYTQSNLPPHLHLTAEEAHDMDLAARQFVNAIEYARRTLPRLTEQEYRQAALSIAKLACLQQSLRHQYGCTVNLDRIVSVLGELVDHHLDGHFASRLASALRGALPAFSFAFSAGPQDAGSINAANQPESGHEFD